MSSAMIRIRPPPIVQAIVGYGTKTAHKFTEELRICHSNRPESDNFAATVWFHSRQKVFTCWSC
jgi:hypothetical protein